MNNQKQETSMKRAIMMNMFWALFSLLINTLMNFLITPYVTNNIGVEAYGFVALANTFISYVDVISVSLNCLRRPFYFRGIPQRTERGGKPVFFLYHCGRCRSRGNGIFAGDRHDLKDHLVL